MFFETQPRAHGSSLKLPRHLLCTHDGPMGVFEHPPKPYGGFKKIRNAAFN
jgi:hypothetical protein